MKFKNHSLVADFSDAERDFVQLALEKHSTQHAAGLNARPVEIAVRSSDNQLVGGLLGSTAWEWLIIDMLWVADEIRSQGLGATLLEQAEQQAKLLGCTAARTETFDFQALPFYKKHGYKVYAELNDFPAGHTEYQLRKQLA